MKKIKFILIGLLISFNGFSQGIYEKGNIAEDTISLSEVSVVGSITATRETPFTFQNLSSKEISLKSNGSEPAVLLSTTPSVTYYSDNGTGTGYIYYRIRGIDQTRINSTLNGVPLNEPEDQGIYYNNYGGFLNSVSSVQIIRGVGLSKPGVSSYGGSINFSSLEFDKTFSANGSFLYGSFNTIQGHVGINSPNFFINGSYMKTDGFKYNSFNDSWSTFYGAKKDLKKSTLTLYGFVGKQKNGMAWLGEDLDSIYSDNKFNSNTSDETDNFTQIHNQAIWKKRGLSATVYHTYLTGWYDMDMAHFDSYHSYGDLIYRLNLKSNWIGTILNYNLSLKNWLNTNYGISAYTYYRDHHGTYSKYNEDEPWYYEYQNTGHRNEFSPYAKGNLRISLVSIYGDIQYRYTDFSYDGLSDFETQSWNFLNWSGGTSIRIGKYSSVYYGIGKTNREPTRTDLFAGWDDYDPSSYVPIKSESALSNEFGYKYLGKSLVLQTNIYYMNFQNEIVLNGQVGPNGIVLHQNATKSFRSGWEMDGKYLLNRWEFIWVSSFSYNRIIQDGEKFQPVLSSPVIINADIVYNLNKAIYIGFNSKYNSKSYIDFSNEHTLPGYSLYNIYAGVGKNNLQLRGTINNLGNELILGNAIMNGDTPSYFVMAGINGSISISLKF